LTLLITCLHLYIDYRNDLSAIDERLQQIESSYLPTIANALWTEDLTQLEVQVTGIKNLPEVILVQLQQNDQQLFSKGENLSEYTREGRWPITYDFDGQAELLGELYVVTDLLPVYQKLAEKAVLTLLTQGAKTFIASFIIFFIVYYLVTRHLSQIASSMANFELSHEQGSELKLAREKAIDDELGYLVDEYNKMKSEVSTTFIELTKQKQKAEEVNRLKSEFLANISHEVKTPMNGVYGMAQLLIDTDLNEEQQDYLKVIKSSSEHMLELLNNILDFSKIEANKIELDIKPFDLPALVNEVSILFQASADEKKLALVTSVDESIVNLMLGDSVRINQVLVNLISNALKFTDKGSINIAVQALAAQSNENNDVNIQFSVTDSGIGIPEDKQDVIFEQFMQADSSTTRHYGGTGLGLSICHRLVELMGGRLELKNADGRGCCFYFTLPLIKTNKIIATEHNKLALLAGLKVLIIDDYSFNTRIMEELLTTWKMEPTAFNDPELAIKEINIQNEVSNHFDYILLDKCMPNVDGFAAFDMLMKLNLTKVPKVIMTSAQAEVGDVAKCERLGINAFISLPAGRRQIQQVFLDHLPINAASNKQIENSSRPLDPNGLLSTILLVEDSRINQQVCRAMLKELGCNLLIADNGEEAIKLWHTEKIDLILMDCHMPVMDGFEATIAIRKLEKSRGSSTPIIAVTASNADQDMKRCLEIGMNSFIAKPYVREVLIEEINKHLVAKKLTASV